MPLLMILKRISAEFQNDCRPMPELLLKWQREKSITTGILMKNLREGLRWFEQAEADLKTAKDCLKTENYYASAFFSQQAAEKALKGFLYAQGFRALVTHSVMDLLKESAVYHKGFEKFIDQGRELDRHYIGARYPNFYPEGPAFRYYTKEEADRCVGYAESILRGVGKFLRK